ncbi:MAG: efflux RND transporter permease subunit [Bacteroidales bacterium]|nr:efflux RND transporter permease subunit [Bacteroidales bacterium]
MLNNIIRFSLNNRLTIVVCAVVLLLWGGFTSTRMDVDVFPDLNAPTVVIMTEANGMAAEEVEQLVTFRIETAVNGATDVRRVRSSSTTGFSIVWVEFDWDTDIYRARQIVSEKIAVVREELPAGVGNPTLGPQSSILGEMLFVALTSDSTSLQELRTLADWTVRPRILAMGGVAQVSVIGGEMKEYQLLLNPARMRHYGVSLDEVLAATRGMNENKVGGSVYEYGNEYIVRGMLSTNDVEKLGMAVIKSADGGPVCVNDVARVCIGNHTPRMGTASHRGCPAVMMTVTKQPDASTVNLTRQIDEALEDLRKQLPADVRISTDIYRQERFIDSSIGNVRKSLVEGGLLVVVILFLFLMNVRATLISLVTMPLALVMSILVLHAFGLTINTMSLGGFAIAIGSLVDDAIVDVENVYRHLRENSLLPLPQRRSVSRVVFEASKEIRMPVLNSTLIIIASFTPLFFLSGIEGRLLAPLGIAFITALCASTLVALTLTPVLCSLFLAKGGGVGSSLREPVQTLYVRKCYSRVLAWGLRRRRPILWATALLLVVALVVFANLGRSFLPPFNEGSFTINVSTMPGIALDESDRVGARADSLLLEIPEILTVGRKTGRAELDEHALGVNNSEIEAPFQLGKRSKDEVIADIRERMGLMPGINLEVGSPITHRIDAMLSGTEANIAVKLFGTDLTKMYEIGNRVKTLITPVRGLADVNVEQQVERPQLQIVPRRELMAKHGVSMAEFAEAVEVLLAGEEVSQVYEDGKAFPLTLKVDADNCSTAERIKDLMIDAAGRKIPLSDIAEVVSAMGPNTINRENVARRIVVSANVAGRDLRGAVNEIRRVIDEQIVLPEGYHIAYGGQFESEQSASRTLLVASSVAILLIFLLLYNQFRVVTESVVILLNLPLALIGGVLAVGLTGGELSIPGIIGFISLFGIATRNGMLLIARYKDLRAEGHGLRESIVKGSLDRLNPILMTALTSALALVPMVMGGELPGNEIQSPMAMVILGGLVTSTMLNGLIVPIVYEIIAYERK